MRARSIELITEFYLTLTNFCNFHINFKIVADFSITFYIIMKVQSCLLFHVASMRGVGISQSQSIFCHSFLFHVVSFPLIRLWGYTWATLVQDKTRIKRRLITWLLKNLDHLISSMRFSQEWPFWQASVCWSYWSDPTSETWEKYVVHFDVHSCCYCCGSRNLVESDGNESLWSAAKLNHRFCILRRHEMKEQK